MRLKNIFLCTTLLAVSSIATGCNPGGGNPTPKPDPKPETTVSVTVLSSNATFGDDNRHIYYADDVKQKTAFDIKFTPKKGFLLDKSCFTVTIGGYDKEYEDSFTFSNNTFTVKPEYLVDDMIIVCAAKIDPVDPPEPTEQYNINVKMEHVDTSNLPKKVGLGELLYGYITPEEGYRLPDPSKAKPGSKKDEVEFRAESRLLIADYDYYYRVYKDESNGSEYALIFMPFDTIETEINIIGTTIKQLNIGFAPGEGHWDGGGTSKITTTVDTGTLLYSAFTSKYPIYKEGYTFDKWTYDSKSLDSNYVLTDDDDNHTYIASYKEIKYIVTFQFENTLEEPEVKEWKYKQEISYTLKAKKGYILPQASDVTVIRTTTGKDPEKMVLGKDYSYNPTAVSGNNFVIYANSVTGGFTVRGKCISSYTVTFDANGGTFSEGKASPVTTYAIEGDTIKDAMNNAGISIPTKTGEHFDYWTINDEAVTQDYKINKDVVIKASYSASPNFNTIDWKTLCDDTSNLTFEQFKTKYGKETFIGEERMVWYECNYGGTSKPIREIKVRVIGENHDTLSSDPEKKAMFTFEFEEIVKRNIKYCSENSNEYINSNLRTELSSAKENLIKHNDGLTVKKVKKTTLKGGNKLDDHTSYVETDEELFALSGAEIGTTIIDEDPMIKQMNQDTVKFKQTGTVLIDIEEGKCYEYYLSAAAFPELRKKTWYKEIVEEGDPHNIIHSYTLRSPHAYSYNNETTKCDPTGSYGIFGSSSSYESSGNGHYTRFPDGDTINNPGLAPAFCI